MGYKCYDRCPHSSSCAAVAAFEACILNPDPKAHADALRSGVVRTCELVGGRTFSGYSSRLDDRTSLNHYRAAPGAATRMCKTGLGLVTTEPARVTCTACLKVMPDAAFKRRWQALRVGRGLASHVRPEDAVVEWTRKDGQSPEEEPQLERTPLPREKRRVYMAEGEQDKQLNEWFAGLCKPLRLRARRGEDGIMRVLGRYGELYAHRHGELAWCYSGPFASKKQLSRLLETGIPGQLRVEQQCEEEAVLVFSPEYLTHVAVLAGAPKIRELSETHRASALAALRPARE